MADNECKGCIYESTIEELRRDAERNSNQHREFYDKFGKHDKDIAISAERYNNLLSIIGDLKSSVDKMASSIEDLKSKPSKKWENITTYVLTAIVGGVIAFLFTQLCLK